MKKLLALLLLIPLLAYADTPPAGYNGDIQYNNNGKVGPYKLGTNLSVTTSGTSKFLNSTTTGSTSALGTTTTANPYRTGEVSTGLFTSGSGQVGVEALGTTAMSLTSTAVTIPSLNSFSLVGSTTAGSLNNWQLGTNLSATTTGGITTLNATGGGGGGSTPTGPAGGDLSGAYPNPTVTNLTNALPAYSSFKFLSSVTSTLTWLNAAGKIDPRTYGAKCVGPGYVGGLSSVLQGVVITSGGTSYTNGTYTTVPLTGGTGSGGQATVVVAGNKVTSVTITTAGTGYKLRDQLSALAANIGGTGSGFNLQVAHFNSNTLPVYDGVSDDTAAFQQALYDAQNTGQVVMVPNGCWVSPTNNPLILPQGVVMMGEGFGITYGYNMLGGTADAMPVLYGIGHPSNGIRFNPDPNSALIGFEVNFSNDGAAFSNTACIGTEVNGTAGTSPITLAYMSPKGCQMGFGSHDDQVTYFLDSRFSDYSANVWGIYGHASDFSSLGDTFGAQNSGAIHLTGFGGEARITQARIEFTAVGLELAQYSGIQITNTQWDHVARPLVIGSTSSDVYISNSSFQASGSPGTSGSESHITLSRTTSGPMNLHIENTVFSRGGEAYPKYVLEATTTGSYNDYIQIDGGNLTDSYTKDVFNFQNGRPAHMKLDIQGLATQGAVANGLFSNQAPGLPPNGWTGLFALGDIVTLNNNLTPLSEAWPYLVARAMGTGPTVLAINDFSNTLDCSIVDLEIMPNLNPGGSNYPVMAWQSAIGDPSFGGGFFQSHQTDTNSCRLGGLTWMGVAAENKVLGQDAGCVKTGSWTNDSIYTGKMGTTSSTNGNSLACSTTTNGAPIYVWYVMRGNNGGTFNVNVDGGTNTAVTTQGQNSFIFPSTTTSHTTGAVRLSPVTAGSHTVNVALTSTTSTSNTVTILGIGSSPLKPMAEMPTVFYGNQIPDAGQPGATNAYTGDQLNQTSMLFADGLNINLANIQNYYNASTDLGVNGFAGINNNGQTHIADGFKAIMQPHRASGLKIDPRDYGASCNSLYFAATYDSGNNASPVSTTNGSPTISVGRYKFQPGIATARGGGDVGKRFCIGSGTDIGGGDTGPCSCVVSVNTSNNTANLSLNAQATKSGAYGVMGGYPTNPNDPTTCQDDTIPIQNAGLAAKITGSEVVLPSNCMVHNLTMPESIIVGGNSPPDFYLQGATGLNDTLQEATIINCGFTGFGSDTSQCIQLTPHTLFKNFLIRAPIFPYTAANISSACIGYSTNSRSGPGAQLLLENVSTLFCPVAIGQAYGYNQPVSFVGSITDNGDGTSTMAVSSITSHNFFTADEWTFNSSSPDFLGIGRVVTGPGVTANTVITAAPAGVTTGNYTLNKAMNVTSTALSSPSTSGQGMEIREWHGQHANDGMAYNGDFTDSMIIGSVCSGTFMQGCAHFGPLQANFGNGSIRWIAGRMEEIQGPSAITCDSCGLDITGLDMQFNKRFNIRTVGNGSTLQFTGGHMYAGGHGNSAIQDKAQIQLGGSNANVAVDGVVLTTNDPVWGGTTTYLFSTATGFSNARASVTGGNTVNGETITGLFNWANGTPSFYKQDTAGWPLIDTTNTVLSVTSTGGVGLGVGAAHSGVILDLLSNTTTTNSSLGLPKGTTGNRPSSPLEGMIRWNTTLHQLEGYNGTIWSAVGGATVLPFSFGGLILSNDGGSPNTVLDITSGSAASDDGTTQIVLGGAITKTTGSWTAGSGNGCLDTGAIANSTWYTNFIIENVGGAVVDDLCSTSATTPTYPTGYTVKRRIGSFKTDGSANVIPYTPVNGNYYWTTPSLDVTTTGLGTSGTLFTLNVPTGVQVTPLCEISISNSLASTTTPVAVYISGPDETDLATTTTSPFTAGPGYSYLALVTTGSPSNAACPFLTTNTSGQIRARSSLAGTSLSIITRGWQD